VGIAILYLIYGLILALIRHRKGAVLSAIGISVLMASAVNDILHNEMIISTGYFFPLGLLICIFSLSFLISRNFARLYNSVVQLSRRLISLDKIKNAFIKNTSKYNLENPFKAILENANADKGFIYIWEESIWVLKVFLSIAKEDYLVPVQTISDFSTPSEDNASFPYLLVYKTIASDQSLVLHNAMGEEGFQDDHYIRNHHVKSAFCMPIKSQGTLIGLLYLENQNIEGAFNKEKLEMLDLLSPQLTTMLDNIEIFRQLELLNRNLEQKVVDRTAELNRQKQNLEVANQKINDSINYARHIQDSILLPEEEIRESVTDLFIYNLPREQVSGDFYWFSKVKHIMVIAAIDCTGHGIPGAFMSMIGHTLLNDIVNGMNILKPSQIMKYLNRGVKELLHQTSAEVHAQDGMDLALCTIDPDKKILQYCGAKNPLYLVRNKELEVIKADPWSVGGRKKRFGIDEEVEFTNHMISLDQPVSVYMLTDGYLDQFGGEGDEKFNLDRFKKLLLKASDQPMTEQKLIFAQTMEDWKKDQPQIDDMLVVGIRL
jgi:serine phosphatase RsbU (regulator of sigma subunit)